MEQTDELVAPRRSTAKRGLGVTVSGVGTDHFDADLNGWIPEEIYVPMPSDVRYGSGGGLPLSPPFGSGGSRDYILSILSPDLSQLVHSSKFGNAGWELGGEVTFGPDGFIYAIGRTRTGEEEAGASQDVFVLKVKP